MSSSAHPLQLQRRHCSSGASNSDCISNWARGQKQGGPTLGSSPSMDFNSSVSTLDPFASSLFPDPAETFEDELPLPKPHSVTRLAFQNCGPQPQFSNNARSCQLADAFASGQYDIFLFAKHGSYPPSLRSGQSWHDRLSLGNKQKNYSVVGYNRHERLRTSCNCIGGYAITVSSPFRDCKNDCGWDLHGLGWLCWFCFFQKGGGFKCVIFAYFPCSDDTTEGTAWRQRLRHFRNLGISGDPCDLFIYHFLTELQSWLDLNDHLVLGIDANSDVWHGKLRHCLADHGLFESICSNHPSTPPPTYNRNKQERVIDGIFYTPDIDIQRCGFLPFDSPLGVISDHWLLWVDITNASFVGDRQVTVCSSFPSWVWYNDPRDRHRYVACLICAYEDTGVHQLCHELADAISKHLSGATLSPQYIAGVQAQLTITTEAICCDIDRRLCHIFAGKLPWSPRLWKFCDVISYWHRIICLCKGVLTSREYLLRLASKLDLFDGYSATLDEAILKLQEAYTSYQTAKKQAWSWRIDHHE